MNSVNCAKGWMPRESSFALCVRSVCHLPDLALRRRGVCCQNQHSHLGGSALLVWHACLVAGDSGGSGGL